MEVVKRIIYFIFPSWILWQKLLHPLEHPVFWRTIKPSNLNHLSYTYIGLLFSVIIFIIGAFMRFFLPTNLGLPIDSFILLTLVSSTYTSLWIAKVSTTIVHQYYQATYDPLCVTPAGAEGINWAFATGILHRHDAFGWIDSGRVLLSFFIFFILLLAGLTLLFQEGWHLDYLKLLIETVIFSVIVYTEHVQSVVLGIMVALLMPQYNQNSAEIHIWSIFVFLAVQISILIFIVVIGQILTHSYTIGEV